MSAYVQTPKGICYIGHGTGGEFTLCGDAFDLASEEPGYEWKATACRTVTCRDCGTIILDVRNVKVRRAP